MKLFKHVRYVSNLVRFSFNANPLLYFSLGISLFSVVVELLAMSSLLPLFDLISAGKPSINTVVAKTIIYLGFPVSTKTLLWAFILLFSVRIFTQLIGQSLSMYMGKRVMAQLGSLAFKQIVYKLSLREISERSIGFFISLAGDESFRASTLITSLIQFTSTFALALFYYLAIFMYSPKTGFLVMLFLGCCLVALFWILKASHNLGIRQTLESRKSHSIFLETLNNIKPVRAFSAEKYVSGIYRSILFGYTKILFLIDEVALLTKLIPVLLLLVSFSVWLILANHAIESIGLAFIMTIIVYLMRFFPTVGQGVNLLIRIVSDAKSGKDVTEILNTPSSSHDNFSKILGNIETIALNDICFSYENTSKKILANVNWRFKQGNSYALVGRSGIGKSTLIDILLKFYLPTDGNLSINNISISEVADADIRKRIILVSQDAAIFDDTVINNVCMGIEATYAEVQIACKLACINDVIENMPDRYEARLQYQGKNLSGGQRQRIGIARALLRIPDVLIFDESTSALDKKTQEAVVENILREYGNKIVIFVTHDPQIMSRVNEVVDLEKVNLASVSLSKNKKVTS